MIERKRKLIFIQASLLVIGILVIFFTYKDNNKNSSKEEIIPLETQEKIKEKNSQSNSRWRCFL